MGSSDQKQATSLYEIIIEAISQATLPTSEHLKLQKLKKFENGTLELKSIDASQLLGFDIRFLFKLRVCLALAFLTILSGFVNGICSLFYVKINPLELFNLQFSLWNILSCLFSFIEPIGCLLFVYAIKRNISNFDYGSRTFLSFAILSDILQMISPQEVITLPRFFSIFIGRITRVLMASIYLLKNRKSTSYLVLACAFVTICYLLSIMESSMVLFSKKFPLFYASAISIQLYPIIFFKILEYETEAYHSIFRKFLVSIEEKSEAKSAFISRMSHELRTPLHGLLSLITLLKQTPLTTEQQTYLSNIDSCGSLILDLIMKVLDLSRIESGRLESHPTKFSLFKLLQDISQSVSSLAEKKNLDFFVSFSLNPNGYDVEGDQSHLKEILVNLIGNALKFTDKGNVTVSVSQIQRDEKTFIRFEVKDTGVGIPECFLPHLFEPFAQESSNKKRHEGSGLGLSLTKTFVELLNGSIGVESQKNVGSLFWVELPFKLLPSGTFYSPLTSSPILLSPKTQELKFGIYSSDSYFQFLHTYLSYWNLPLIKISSLEESKELDLLIVENNFDFLLDYVNLGFEKKGKVLFLSSISNLYSINQKIEEKGLQNQVINLPKPLTVPKLHYILSEWYQNGTPFVDLHEDALRGLKLKRPLLSPSPAPLEAKEIMDKNQIKSESTIQVLVVEDNPINQMVMRTLLERTGVSFEIVSSGEKAVELFQHFETIPLIFMDIEVEGKINGLRATSQIRALENQEKSRSYIVAMTGRALDTDINEAQHIGCDDYFIKPVDLEKILNLLNKVIKNVKM